MRPTLLIVDDDEDIRSQMRWALTSDYDVILAENRQDALEGFKARRPSVVLLDLGLPPDPAKPTEGFAVLAELLGKDSQIKVIIISGQAERENALRAIAEGAYDFIPKPVEVDELRVILKRAFHIARLEREYHEIQRQFSDQGFEGIAQDGATLPPASLGLPAPQDEILLQSQSLCPLRKSWTAHHDGFDLCKRTFAQGIALKEILADSQVKNGIA